MTDGEMTKLCAEAMGYAFGDDWWYGHNLEKLWIGELNADYDPLHNDAQAMALVKKLGLTIDPAQDEPPFDWRVVVAFKGDWDDQIAGEQPDLNRAIVQCVALLQKRCNDTEHGDDQFIDDLLVGLHADVLDDFKDQLLIVFLKRLKQKYGDDLVFPVAETDDTGQDLLAFKIDEARNFVFVLEKKS